VIGTGLIGGSLGLALRARGWHVSGRDADPERARAALELGALDALGDDPAAEVAFVATPLHAVVPESRSLLDRADGAPRAGVVTDVSGVKSMVVEALDHPRFIGGHPMAGSEQVGLKGADPEIFVGATWVLTPTARTDPEAYASLQSIIGSLGADVVALAAADHDRLVAMVSHVPHLVAATLMNEAADDAQHEGALLRLAAGGFRDMTRVAAGHPGIWPDICADNAPAIVGRLDRLVADLSELRRLVGEGDRARLLELLDRASAGRRNLPARAVRPENLAEVRVPVPDREGVLAEITTLAGDLGINIYDIGIAHSAEGPRGVLMLVVGSTEAAGLVAAVAGRGYRPTVQDLA